MQSTAPSRLVSPLAPDLAVQWADHPDVDPVDRVHFALDAGFGDADFTQEEAARLAGFGARRLRYLLAQENSNYRIEIDKRRMAHAEKLLQGTTYLVSAIAKLCGYRNASAFCKRFSQTHGGMTPARYRVGMAGGPKRAGGPTGATKNPAARARARKEGLPEPSPHRLGWGPGESEAFAAEWDHAVRQARARGLLPRHGGISIVDINRVRGEKRRRGVAH
jgi:AraC-like DNA-binding protein